MPSVRQIAANQRNAQQSTGPRTDAGKLISSQNSTTHGLTGQTISRSPKQKDAYNTYYESMLPDLAPASTLELDFANRIIHDSWRLNSAGAMNENLLMNGWHENSNGMAMGDAAEDRALAEARAFRADAKTFNLLSLYEQRLQRAILKNLAALKAMQKERKAEVRPTFKPIRIAHKPAPQPIEIPLPSPENGFAYSTPPQDPAPPPQDAETNSEIMAA